MKQRNKDFKIVRLIYPFIILLILNPLLSLGQLKNITYDSLKLYSFKINNILNSKHYFNVEYVFLKGKDTIRMNSKTAYRAPSLGKNNCGIDKENYFSIDLENYCGNAIERSEISYYKDYVDYNDPRDCSLFVPKKKLNFNEKRKKIVDSYPIYVDIDSRLYKIVKVTPCNNLGKGE